MEKVQYALEGTLPELKDLHEKGLFSKNEIHQITKRRTTFETALIRRVARKEDYFKYAEYEINLEQLRKVRWKRLGYDRNPPPPSASTYSFPRRIMYILKRATAKFSGDLSVWLAYVEYASREGMRKVVASGLTSALQHHPTSPTLYLLSSYHHLHPTAPFPTSIIPSSSSTSLPSAAASEDEEGEPAGFAIEGTQVARTTLLLGLRMLPHNRDLWREYIKLELGWVEALRRRWKILGIDAGKGRAVADEELIRDRDDGEGAFGPEGEDARKAILGGQLVVHAIRSALEKIPATYRDGEGDGMEFREDLLVLFRSYPSPLRKICLEEVYSNLDSLKEVDSVWPKARLILLTKTLYDRAYEPGRKATGGIVLEGEALVDEYGKIGQNIRKIAKNGGIDKWSDVAGSWLCDQIATLDSNPDLAQYLLAVLGFLCKSAYSPSADLLVKHLRLLASSSSPNPSLLSTARAHAAQHPSDPTLALALLNLERQADPPVPPQALHNAFTVAIKNCTRTGLSAAQEMAVTQIWLDYATTTASQSADPKVADATWRRIIRESLRSAKDVPSIHPALLYEYLSFRIAGGEVPSAAVQNIVSTYAPSPDFYESVIDSLSDRFELPALSRLYESWRGACKTPEQRIGAAMTYGSLLLSRGKAKIATDVIDVVRREVRDDSGALAGLEGRWKLVLDASRKEEQSVSDSASDETGSDEDEVNGGSMDVDFHVAV